MSLKKAPVKFVIQQQSELQFQAGSRVSMRSKNDFILLQVDGIFHFRLVKLYFLMSWHAFNYSNQEDRGLTKAKKQYTKRPSTLNISADNKKDLSTDT